MIKGKYSPIDPVAYGAPVKCPNETTGVLSALLGDNSDLIREAARLWITPTDFVADVTYGRGVFWRQLPDIEVAGTDVFTDGIDCRALPYNEKSVDVLVLDPPYQPTHGKPERSFGVGRSYRLNDSLRPLQTISDVQNFYKDSISEAARVVRTGGRIMVKTQDITYNHRLHLMHLDVLRYMVDSGFDLADMFVLLNKTRMPQPTTRQQRAHRSHSYLLVGVRAER
jgi:hypothetical protein